jgi:ribonucleoside-diphosphate reductase alpha chain
MREFLSEFKLQTGYLKFDPSLGRKETWEEAIRGRVMNMHRLKYMTEIDEHPKLKEYIDFAEEAYVDKLVLGSQRALQFGGVPILAKNSKMYNCITSYCDRVPFFREAMWWLLSGCGVGFSVQTQHINKLPTIKQRNLGTKTFVIPDSIEGWADAPGVLLASFFQEGDEKFAEYYGYDVKFDTSQIREKGAPISSGFKAPGPEPLKIALEKIEALILKTLGDSHEITVEDILAYDIVMHASNAVLAGGVRRSATICIFSKTSIKMLNAKTGNWFEENPQRARSNNSVALLKGDTTYEEFMQIMESVKQFGEPGFVWLDDLDIAFNPCVEIGMVPKLKVRPRTEEEFGLAFLNEQDYVWVSGWQGCNLVTGNGAKCRTKAIFLRMCKALAILGTLQAGYTTFEYVGTITEQIFRKEALLGCAIAGWMNNPKILFDQQLLAEGVALIKEINDEMAPWLGINPAARLTCSKPDGNGGVIMEGGSGFKLEEATRYIRYVQVNADEYGVEHFKNLNPELVEVNSWDETGKGYAIGFAIENGPEVLLKRDIYGVKHLEMLKDAVQWWVEPGTIVERCTIPSVRHNISSTISVDNWDDVGRYIYDNRQYFAGISLLHLDGSLEYNQAPFSEVLTHEELIEKYGDAAFMASGLIVDGLHAFGDNLWTACNAVLYDTKLEGNRTEVFLKKEWVRRAKKFSKNYFRSNHQKMTYCLKDVHRFYRFNTIKKNFKPVKWAEYFESMEGIDVDTLGAVACAGGKCEI